jgi:hypothetical protein
MSTFLERRKKTQHPNMEVVMERRFFVTIFSRNKSALADLRRLDLDLFGVAERARGESSIGGLLTEASIEQLRKAGYRVEVHEEYVEQARKSQAHRKGRQSSPVPIMDDKAWLKEFNRRKKVQ